MATYNTITAGKLKKTRFVDEQERFEAYVAAMQVEVQPTPAIKGDPGEKGDPGTTAPAPPSPSAPQQTTETFAIADTDTQVLVPYSDANGTTASSYLNASNILVQADPAYAGAALSILYAYDDPSNFQVVFKLSAAASGSDWSLKSTRWSN